MGRLSAVKPRLGAAPSRLRPPPKVAEKFYLSAAWQQLKARRKLDSDYFAALQRRSYPKERLILDHVRERKDGGDDLDPRNTEWLTASEHNAKTARSRAKRAEGRT